MQATAKLRQRLKVPLADEPVAEPDGLLGNWHATALFWRPQVALFVNDRTRLPVFVPLAPAATVIERFPAQLALVLEDLGVEGSAVEGTVAAMADLTVTKSQDRSVIGSMNEAEFMATAGPGRRAPAGDLVALSVEVAHVPSGPLRGNHVFPEVAVRAAFDDPPADPES